MGFQLSFKAYNAIVAQHFKSFKFLVYKMSFLIIMVQRFIVVKVYNIGDNFWFQWIYKGPNMYLKIIFDQLIVFSLSVTTHCFYVGHYGPTSCDNVFPELVWNRVKASVTSFKNCHIFSLTSCSSCGVRRCSNEMIKLAVLPFSAGLLLYHCCNSAIIP